jgi:TetR/AcrR family transcriptional regulator
MSPRKKEAYEQIRDERRMQILNAALTVYVSHGYNATDMNAVAEKADMAKGLLYYYFKTKQELFCALFAWMIDRGMNNNDEILRKTEDKKPDEKLIAYLMGIFRFSVKDPRQMMFYIRMPFDAIAVFGDEGWKEGKEKSKSHQTTLAKLVQNCINAGSISGFDANTAASCLWSVFVAGLFEVSSMMQNTMKVKYDREILVVKLMQVLKFCFQGLGLEQEQWENLMIEELKKVDEGEELV